MTTKQFFTSSFFAFAVFFILGCGPTEKLKLTYNLTPNTDINYELVMRKTADANKLVIDVKFHIDSIHNGQFYITSEIQKMGWDNPQSELDNDMNNEFNAHVGTPYAFSITPQGNITMMDEDVKMPFDVRVFFPQFSEKELSINESWNTSYDGIDGIINKVKSSYVLKDWNEKNIQLQTDIQHIDNMNVFGKSGKGRYMLDRSSSLVEKMVTIFTAKTALGKLELIHEITRL